MDVLGIDISKDDFHTCLIQGAKRRSKTFVNTPTGYRQVQAWLKNRRCTEVHACMESTGAYWTGLATALYNAGMKVSVVNPSQTSFFSRSQLRRTKTDEVDAEMIADYCVQRQPGAWVPPPPQILELRALLNYRDHLVRERVRLRQVASQTHMSADVRRLHLRHIKTLNSSIAALKKQLETLVKADPKIDAAVRELCKTKGFGPLSAASIVARLPVDRLRNAKAAVAQAGLSPGERSSGTSVRGKRKICKVGDADLRGTFYMPALAAIRSNNVLRPFVQRLKARGKEDMVIVVAVMRKLLVHAYTVLRNLQRAQAAAA